ncbi:MAG: ABC transporter ATP-binding protein/permease [Lachnospiraceae bacterium]|nr:ABC transporter ATP-binding protein/permease [Lachnospiraceae bacterium]
MARNTYNVDEDLEKGFDISQFKRSFVYIRRYKKPLIIAFIVSIIAIICGLILPLFTEHAIDTYIPDKDIKSLLIAGAGIVLTVIAQAICNKVRSRTVTIAGQSIIRDMRRDVYEHLQKLPFDYFDSRPHGKILIRVINNINSVSDFLSNGFISMILETISLVLIAGFMFYMHSGLALVVLCGFPVFGLFMFAIKKAQRRAWQIQANKQSNYTAYFSESINGERVTQGFAREKYNSDINKDLAAQASKGYVDAVSLNHAVWPVTMIISKFTIYLLYIIGVIYFRDTLKVGIIISMAAYAGRFWNPIQNISNQYNQLITTMSYLERIFQLLDEPVTVTDVPGAEPLPDIKGDVEFKDVLFEYEKGIPVLKEVSFHAAAGESIALVGPTGAGKSTIVNLVSRFYNLKGGQVLIDGHDISKATLLSIRSQMGIMLQDTFIFSGTIMDNIRYGRLDATDEECIAAAKRVFANDFIEKLPNGYQTVVNERGDMLSAGQRQLLSFARTLLSDPKILILDEATSSIDTNTELLVQEGIKELLKNRTSFIVAHRISTIKNCTRIMYISDGEIAEAGSHDELMEKKGYYYDLYMSQLTNE